MSANKIYLLKELLTKAETPETPAAVDSEVTTCLHGYNYSQEQEKQLNWSGDPAETPLSLRGFSYGQIVRMFVDGELDSQEEEWFSYKNPQSGGMPNLKLILMRKQKI